MNQLPLLKKHQNWKYAVSCYIDSKSLQQKKSPNSIHLSRNNINYVDIWIRWLHIPSYSSPYYIEKLNWKLSWVWWIQSFKVARRVLLSEKYEIINTIAKTAMKEDAPLLLSILTSNLTFDSMISICCNSHIYARARPTKRIRWHSESFIKISQTGRNLMLLESSSSYVPEWRKNGFLELKCID